MKAVVFDCWGTLFSGGEKLNPVDRFAERAGRSMKDYSFRKTFERHLMLKRPEDLRRSVAEILEETGVEPEDGLVRGLVDILQEDDSDGMVPYPDAMENLKKLRENYKLGMLTNSIGIAFPHLAEKYGIYEVFDAVVKSYDCGMIKPDPEFFQLVLDKLGVEKEEAVMVGDSLEDDVKAAEKVGMEAVLLDRDNEHPEYGKRITSLDEIYQYL